MPRIFHISDVHLHNRRHHWAPGDYLSKHLTGWLNWSLTGRGKRFEQAAAVMAAFRQEVVKHKPDLVVFSGDATALGFAEEIEEAAELLGVNELPGFTVPGNHDYYTQRSLRHGAFESAFAPWLAGQRVDKEHYPFARQVGGVWFIGVNSSVPNWMPIDARGRVGGPQLGRLDQLIETIGPSPKVLVTHYPPCDADGRPEGHWHGLRDWLPLAQILESHDIQLWLCGHRHRPFQRKADDHIPFHIVCGGSSTQRGTAGYWDLFINGDQCLATLRAYNSMSNDFEVADPLHGL